MLLTFYKHNLAGSWSAGAGFYIGLSLMMTGCSGGDPTATDPELIFEDGFETSYDRVTLLDEGGTMVRGFSAWLKLSSELTDLRLRRSSDYEFVDCERPAEWFHQVSGDGALLVNRGALTCQRFTEKRFDFDNGRWLVSDNSRGIIYYRVWKLNH
ncbi:MAG: hypothetical protein AB2747_14225 [Candidatus Thiodiazotropha taylori]|uniref:Uncharacterized protein n=1 Tax=Candidatus Thiodiazotropha taylori TaxID=2792791 RepID=A0A9E4T646_9GAMM|nr:hypothetical protein [Candidatus Thiodiazotropha taylori]MCW4259074.1 hypothetical protein [Candidatus Thiodiazotropha taylori]